MSNLKLSPPPRTLPSALQRDTIVEEFFKKLLNSYYQLWFANGGSGRGIIPPVLEDAQADNGTYYYSSTASKLVFKDFAGVVHALY